MNAARPLPALREDLHPRHVLLSLGRPDDPADKAEIAASVAVARSGRPQRRVA